MSVCVVLEDAQSWQYLSVMKIKITQIEPASRPEVRSGW
jgi:hypothetical protein